MPVDRGSDRPHEIDDPERQLVADSQDQPRRFRDPLDSEASKQLGEAWNAMDDEPDDVEVRPSSPDRPPEKPESVKDRADRMREEVELPEKVRELPRAADVLPNLDRTEIDPRKFSEYSLRLDHPQNGGKANGWRALGYDIDDPDARQEAARDLKDLIGGELLKDGRIKMLSESEHGTKYQVQNGFIGPNGRHATLVTGWRVADEGEGSYPRMNTVWVQPHKEKEDDR